MRSGGFIFGDGERWRCGVCGRVEMVGWDEELEQRVGVPDVVVAAGGGGEVGLLCAECSFDAC
jgi:hypothetical protein